MEEDIYFTIYKIQCKDPEIKEIYVGSTKNYEKRQISHKSTCNNVKSKSYNIKLYTFIRDNGNFDNFEFKVVNEVIFIDNEQKRKVEQIHINLYKPQLNSSRAFCTEEELKEYQKKNSKKYEQYEKRKENKKEYRKSDKYKDYRKEYKKTDKQKEYQRERMKEYRKSDKNKEYRKEYQKERQKTEKYKQYMKEYYQNQKLKKAEELQSQKVKSSEQ